MTEEQTEAPASCCVHGVGVPAHKTLHSNVVRMKHHNFKEKGGWE